MHRAIETRYKGYRFRSRLEARYAVLFDSLGIEWEYEPEGYEFNDVGDRYLPDFKLTASGEGTWPKGQQMWVEIKPVYPTPGELRKLDSLRDATHIISAFLYGPVHDAKMLTRMYHGAEWDHIKNPLCYLALDLSRRLSAGAVLKAVGDACGAQFEFGKSGARA